jgi:hypothetical protein
MRVPERKRHRRLAARFDEFSTAGHDCLGECAASDARRHFKDLKDLHQGAERGGDGFEVHV